MIQFKKIQKYGGEKTTKTTQVTDVTNERWHFFFQLLELGDSEIVREFLETTSVTNIEQAIQYVKWRYQIESDVK